MTPEELRRRVTAAVTATIGTGGEDLWIERDTAQEIADAVIEAIAPALDDAYHDGVVDNQVVW